MKRPAKILTTTALTALMLMLGSTLVFAEGLTVSSDKDSYEIGDKVTVTVDTGSADAVPPDVSVEFAANRLNFENCSAEYGGGGGGLVTFKDMKATIEFTTLSGGAAQIKVTSTGEDSPEPETAELTVSVNGEDTAGSEEVASTSTGVSAGTIDIGDQRVIQTVFADEFMPVLFHKEAGDYNGQPVECAKFDMGDLTLLYTTDASDSDGKFMIYNKATGSLDDFRMIQGIENRFIIVLSDSEGQIPEGYTKAVLDWNSQTLTAFMENNVAAGTAEPVGGIDPGDFFLVYAMSSEGNKGWYRYDKNEGTYQRFMIESGQVTEGQEDDEQSAEGSSEGLLDDVIPGNVQSILVIALAALALVLIIVIIILSVKLRDYDDYYEDYYEDDENYEEDEEEDEEDEDRLPPRRNTSKGVTAASLVGRQMAEDEEEEDDDEAEDEEEDEDEDEEDADDETINEEDDEEEDEEDEEEEERPLTRRERKALEREEKWRMKEEKKAAKRRAQGYEEATPLDWSSFEKSRGEEEEEDTRRPKKSEPPKYMTKDSLPPRKKVVTAEELEEKPKVLHEEEQREKQRRLFEQQQRIEEQRRIEDEKLEAERKKEQQQYIAGKTEELDLDEDFQFEFLNL